MMRVNFNEFVSRNFVIFDTNEADYANAFLGFDKVVFNHNEMLNL